MRVRRKPDMIPVGSRWKGRRSGLEMTVTHSSRRQIVSVSGDEGDTARIQSTNKPGDFLRIFERINE